MNGMKKINKAVIGVDLGGTNISIGKVVNGNVIKENKQAVPAKAKKEIILDLVKDTIKSVFDKDVIAIGMGIPGFVDRKNGIVYNLQNIPSWKEVHIKDVLEKEFKVPVFIENDANCFAIGENIFGKGQETENFVGVTLGTGLGAGIISNNSILNDLNGGSGEFGMIPYLDASYEDYCSGKFFTKKYESDGEKVFKRAKKGKKKALKAYKKFGIHLGKYIKTVIFSVDPEKIILGGSIINAKDFFEKEMNNEVANRNISENQKNIVIEFSEMKNSAILGAAALAF